MLNRQTGGSVLCPSCGKLVGVREEACPYCGRKSPGMWGFVGVLRKLDLEEGATQLIVWGCVVMFVLSLALQPAAISFGGGLFGLLTPGYEAQLRLGASGAGPVVILGRWWTVLTAGWLHGGLIHIFFNMMWVRQLGPATTHLYGPGRMLLIYLVSSAVGFLASSLGGTYLYWLPLMGGRPGAYSVGASAAVFGLLGAMVYAGRRGVAGHLGRQAWGYAIALFVFGLVMPGVDNWALLVGFVGGVTLARALNPMVPEKLDHTVAAVTLLVATLAAIGVSFVVGLG